MPVRCIVYVGLIWLWALYGFVSAWIPGPARTLGKMGWRDK
jgi:uncharacterized RDD family membrane protein YckC